MSFPVVLSSDDRNVNSDPNTGDFRTRFASPIPMSDAQGNPIPYEVALISHNAWYSFPNISETAYDNALFQYNNGVTDKQFTIPTGTYSFTDLNDYIQTQITLNGDVGTNIDFQPNYSTLTTTVTIAGGYNVDLSVSNLYLLFGFSAAQVAAPITVTTTSANLADITNGVDTLLIRMDNISNAYDVNGVTNVLYSYIPSTAPGSSIDVRPRYPMYVALNLTRDLTNFRIYITDQQNRPIDFRGETISYLLHFRPV